MAKPYDTRLIALVAQRPFESGMNKFCKLLPGIFVDGTRASELEFPNDGEIWWMLTAKTEHLAEPGRLVVGSIEDALNFDQHDPTRSQFQVQRESTRDLDRKEGVEIIDLPATAIDDIQELASTGFHIEMPSRPAPFVALRWRSNVYGPLACTATVADGGGRYLVSFASPNAEMTTLQFDRTEFDSLTRGLRHVISNSVSQTQRSRSDRDGLLYEVRHELILGPTLEQIAAKANRLVLEPIEKKLQRFAKQCLTRKQRQDFTKLLDEIEIRGRDAETGEELLSVVGRVKKTISGQDGVLDNVAKTLLESGILGEARIRKAEEELAGRYVREKSAALQAEIEEAVSRKRDELRGIEAKLRDASARLQKEEASRRASLEQEIDKERLKALASISKEREEFESQKAELTSQQKVLKGNLEAVTKELRDQGEAVVNRFLTIAPFLGMTGVSAGESRENATSSRLPDMPTTPMPTFELPGFVRSAVNIPDEGLDEKAFFSRFVEVVNSSGFSYRQIDLARFHLSVKCGEMTVLGGVAGTGKSSLPVLYSQALLGSESGNGRPGCLMININPAWMDIRDLLGHTNTLEGRYFPAESGLYQYLIYAQEEHSIRGGASGLYLACLDEMNLSQVEHYFSDFMMILERDGQNRSIQCFAPEVVGASCPFRPWPRIQVSPAVRFVGTVNFDETTRLLSDRFLDRANLVILKPDLLPNVGRGPEEPLAESQGPMVTLADIARWRKDVALPPPLGALLDDMRPLLDKMGCPLSPRGYRAVCRFVGSALALLSAENAFDLQVAQRIVPKIRSLVTRRQLGALDELLLLLKKSTACPFTETMPLLEELQENVKSGGWELEE